MPTLADDKVVETLTAIAGIGPWTVNVFLIFNLGRPDVMPAADLFFGATMLVVIVLVHAAGVRGVTNYVARRSAITCR